MQKFSLLLAGKQIDYSVKRSLRARCLRLVIHAGGELEVTLPARVSLERLEVLLRPYEAWILRQQLKMRSRTVHEFPAMSDRVAYKTYQAAAYSFVSQYLTNLQLHEKLPPYVVHIKNLRTRWGSCSRQGNLNFNYRIVLLPVELAEYIIIHEVCHLYELNHSLRFWNHVARFLPDHVARRKRLRDYTWKKDRVVE